MKKSGASKVRKTMRALHRDLGFIAIAMVVMYVLSGILLTYRTTDFLKYEEPVSVQLEPGLKDHVLGKELKLRHFKVEEKNEKEIKFTNGTYNRETGVAEYIVKQYYSPLDKFVKLHKVNNNSGAHWFTVSFGVILGFLAISAFWMYKPSTRLFNRGMVFTGVGLVASVVLLVLL